MTTHLEAAERHVEAVEAAEVHRRELFADREVPDRALQLQKIGHSIRQGLSLARIHAELAIAEAIGTRAPVDVRIAGVVDGLTAERFAPARFEAAEGAVL